MSGAFFACPKKVPKETTPLERYVRTAQDSLYTCKLIPRLARDSPLWGRGEELMVHVGLTSFLNLSELVTCASRMESSCLS